MSDKISERIKKGLEIRNMKQSELVEKTGIGKSSISTYLSGDYEPKQRNIYKIAKALNIDESWLMGHDVPMEKVHYIEALELIKNEECISKNKLSKEEATLLENYNKLNNLGKNEAKKRVAELTLIPTYTEIKNNVTELITATKEDKEEIFIPYKSLDEAGTTIAAHDDDLTNEEKEIADKILLDHINNERLKEFNKKHNTR